MVFETLGAINVEGEEILRQLFRFAAKRLGREFTSFLWTFLGTYFMQFTALSFTSYFIPN